MNSVQTVNKTVHKTVHYTRQPALCRDLTSMSRHQGIKNHVATSNQCRDTTQASPGRNLKTGSRHRFSYPVPSQVATSLFQVATPWSFTYVATSFPCRDLPHCRPCRDFNSQQARSRRQFHVATSWRLTYVATSFSCHDLTPAHKGISRSRRRNPCRDLRCCHPCHDLNIDVATSIPTGQT